MGLREALVLLSLRLSLKIFLDLVLIRGSKSLSLMCIRVSSLPDLLRDVRETDLVLCCLEIIPSFGLKPAWKDHKGLLLACFFIGSFPEGPLNLGANASPKMRKQRLLLQVFTLCKRRIKKLLIFSLM